MCYWSNRLYLCKRYLLFHMQSLENFTRTISISQPEKGFFFFSFVSKGDGLWAIQKQLLETSLTWGNYLDSASNSKMTSVCIELYPKYKQNWIQIVFDLLPQLGSKLPSLREVVIKWIMAYFMTFLPQSNGSS